MKTTLVKLLEEEADVSQLSEDNIGAYVQTKEMIGTLTKSIIEPFKERVKQEETGTVYTGKEVEVNYAVSTSEKYHSPATLVSMYEGFVRNVKTNNEAGKQMFGVKRFGDVVAIDASYLQDVFSTWKTTPIGETTRESVTYKGKAVKKIANQDRGKLSLAYEGNLLPEEEKIGTTAVRLYIAADKQVKELKKKVIKPFEDAFKAQAETDECETIFDNKVYGGLTVQVVSAPKETFDYKNMMRSLEEDLQTYIAQTPDSEDDVVFYNDKLAQPRNYVSVDWLLDVVEEHKTITGNTMEQKINVLYKPENAIILSVE